jgi:hypothetical protein
MAVSIPFPLPSHGFALNSKMRVNLDFLVAQFNEFNSGTATWDTVAIGTANNLTGTLTFWNASNINYFTIQAGATFADTTLTLPANAIPNPTSNFISFDSSGVGTWVSGSAAFAPTSGTYVTMSLSSDLTNERVLTAGGGIGITDGGANSTVTISNNGVTSITGTANQVIRDVATGAVTLSLPQSIATSSLVQFGTVRTTTTGDGTNPSLAVYDSNTGWYRTGNDLYQILSGSIVAQTFFADLSTRFPKVATASLVLRDTAGANPTVTINPPTGFTSYTLTMPTDDGTSGDVLSTNGSGVLSWIAASAGANTALSNLASVAINTTLVSDTDNTDDLGTSSIKWKEGFINRLAAGNGTNSSTAWGFSGDADSGVRHHASNANSFYIVAGAEEKMQFTGTGISMFDGSVNVAWDMTDAGEITQPLQPSFLVADGTGASNVTGDATLYTELWPTEIFDQNSDFSSNTFTAPITGRYYFSASLEYTDTGTANTVRQFQIVTSNRNYTHLDSYSLAENGRTLHICALADMDANDTATVTLKVQGSTKTISIPATVERNIFSGSLIN